MGRITKDDRCLIKGLRTKKKMGAKCLIKRVSEQEMVCDKYESFDLKKIDNCGSTEQSGSGRPRFLRTADNVQ